MLAKTWSKLKKWNWNHHLVTVVWDVWQPALSTLSQLLVWTGMVLVWTTTLVCSNKSLKTTNKKRFQMHGWLTKAGSFVQAVATKCHLHTLHWLLPLWYRCTWLQDWYQEPFAFVRLGFSWFIYYWRWYQLWQDRYRSQLDSFLYPDDSDKQGELLRIFQQYFMVSNGAQLIIDEAIEKRKQLAWPCWLRSCTNQRYSPINGDPWVDPSFDWTWYRTWWSNLYRS